MHVEVSCSISGSTEQTYNTRKIIDDKFNDKNIVKSIKKYTNKITDNIEIENIIVLNSLPKDKGELIDKFKKNRINVMEFEDIISDVMGELKTEYFKNDVIRTMQITKYLLLQNPKKFADVFYNTLPQTKRKEFLVEFLSRDEIMKEFKKTNEERLAMILKQSSIKPDKLAKMLENEVLNRRTRKPFIASLMEQKKIGKVYKKEIKVKKEKPLSRFFV
jgi:hypothetical protein